MMRSVFCFLFDYFVLFVLLCIIQTILKRVNAIFISLRLDSDTPLYEQLRNQMIVGIAEGRLLPGEKLPTVRQLASELDINVMTVNKAYSLLKQEGYIVIDRRHGAKVGLRQSGSLEQEKAIRKIEEKLELLIAEAVVQGVHPPRFQELCSQLYDRMKYVQP